MTRELVRELEQVAAGRDELTDGSEERGHVPLGNCAGNTHEHGAGDLAEEVLGGVDRDGAVAEDGELLEGGEGVAHAAAGVADDEVERGLVEGEALLRADVLEVRLDVGVADRAEVEALDAREDGLGDLLRVGGAEDEDDVLGWLLEGLEQRVERLCREHVDLVDDVELVAAAHGGVADAVDDLLAHVVDARARRGVELVDVGVLAGGDQPALLARAVGQVAGGLLAHERLREDARHGGLARAARAAEEVGVARAPLEDGVLEGRHDVLLAHDVGKRLRAVLPVKRFHAAPRGNWSYD